MLDGGSDPSGFAKQWVTTGRRAADGAAAAHRAAGRQ
jgi:hypothetical protein